MSKPALLSLHQALKKSFQSLEENQKVWNSILDECKPVLDSLGNLADQLIALSNVKIERGPLNQFPELHERLRFKLLLAMDTVLGKLGEKICTVQGVTVLGCSVTVALWLMEATCCHRLWSTYKCSDNSLQ
ncbi:hypothetical protein JZ751_000427 [Albula glossodonta]|uniref:Uncharacterized protein n=1 Tax=Albula glossodonta TaxID=121402 RepID=A0A8T2PW29_9TELE|nr:hypothetical protein JZ751_000427 [Albula glossodonta]